MDPADLVRAHGSPLFVYDLDVVSARVAALRGARGPLTEFLVPCPTGEDTSVKCPSCGMASNVEAIRTLLSLQDRPEQSCAEADAIATARLAEVKARIQSGAWW